jgi:hypothetical protein
VLRAGGSLAGVQYLVSSARGLGAEPSACWPDEGLRRLGEEAGAAAVAVAGVAVAQLVLKAPDVPGEAYKPGR